MTIESFLERKISMYDGLLENKLEQIKGLLTELDELKNLERTLWVLKSDVEMATSFLDRKEFLEEILRNMNRENQQ